MKNYFKQKAVIVVLFIAALLIVSCNPTDDTSPPSQNPTPGSFSENFGASATRDFIGRVVDVSNNPIAGVDIKIGSTTVQTDVNGVFVVNGASVFEKFAYITAKKAGYFDGSRTMVPSTGKNNVKITMISNAVTATVASGTTSQVTLPNGTKVSFDGFFKDAAGNAYSGNVQVSMYHLAASNSNISSIMPGSLLAQATDGSAKVLETFGMLNVELKGSAGQKLNIGTGHLAEVSMLIDPAQVASSPASIPLWHFDEVNGFWKQEGSATKVGNKYVGNVSHFSWWNCDYPSQWATLIVNVVNAANSPLANVRVDVLPSGYTYAPQGYTNAGGLVTGPVPANLALSIKIYDACNNVLLTIPCPAIALGATYTLPTVVINNSTTNISTIQGNLTKCNGSNVTNGYVLLTTSGITQAAAITNGSFSFNTLYCGATTANYTLVGYDYDNLQTTGTLTGILSPTNTIVGNIQACTAVTQYITYQIDGGAVQNIIANITANSGTTNSNFLIKGGISAAGSSVFNLFGGTTTLGIYTTANGFSMEGTALNGFISAQSTNTVQFNLSNFGAVGQYIDVSFNGTYVNQTGTHTITGSAHVIRL